MSYLRLTRSWGLAVGGVLGLAGLLTARGATVSGFSPASGPPGTEVVIFGTGLDTTMFVYFGGTDAGATGQITARRANEVRAIVPPEALTGQISVWTSASGSATSRDLFVAAPRITLFTPRSGSPGALVTISGANFATGPFGSRGNVTSVKFNQQAAQFELTGINQLIALVPANGTSGPITVANEAGSFSTFDPFEVVARITGFQPSNGMPGDPIEIRGQNFGNTLRVELGESLARFRVLSPTNVMAWVPTNAINNRIQVTTPAGMVVTSSNFVVLPRIIGFSPPYGPIGTVVTIDGGGFHGLKSVSFSGVFVISGTVVSSTRVEVAVPSGATTGPIELVTTNGTFKTTDDFHLPATLTTFNPNSGSRGTNVTISGANLLGTTAVRFNGVSAVFTNVSNREIRAIVPPLATTGRIAVESPAGEVLSSGNFTVRPVLDGFLPGSAPIGTPIMLVGAALTNLAWVRISDVDAVFTVLTSTNVRAIVPVGAYSGPVKVRTLGGLEAQAPGNFIVEDARPVLISFTPATGLPGTTVELKGQGLRSTARVQFNGTEASFIVRSGSQVDAVVPGAATSGTIAVTTLDGIAFSATPFTVTQGTYALTIESDGSQITLRWSSAAEGFVLQSSAVLGPDAAWKVVPVLPTDDGATVSVTLPLPTTGEEFYRLKQ